MKTMRNLAGVSVLVLLGACQSNGPATTQYSEQTKLDAAKLAFTRVHQLNALAENCQSVNSALFQLSQRAVQNWHQRNDATLAAVNASYMQSVATLQASMGTVKGQLPSLKFLMETDEQIKEDIRDRVQKSSNKAQTCERRLQEFSAESGDLVKHASYGALFIQMKATFPTAMLPRNLPDLSVNYVPRRNAGRSVYVVESALKDKNCQPLTVFNLETNWPIELYGAACGQNGTESFYLVRCEWEQCKFMDEKE